MVLILPSLSPGPTLRNTWIQSLFFFFSSQLSWLFFILEGNGAFSVLFRGSCLPQKGTFGGGRWGKWRLSSASSFCFKKKNITDTCSYFMEKRIWADIDRKFVSLFQVEHLIDLNREIFSLVKWYFNVSHSQDDIETTDFIPCRQYIPFYMRL